jgi:OOP family OmpA-OmpF porin
MKRISFIILLFCYSIASGQDGANSNDALFKKVQQLMDSTLLIEGNIFAPKAYGRAAKSYESARVAIDAGKKQKTVEDFLKETEEFAENTLKAAEVAKLTLQEYLKPRENAKIAKAPMLVPELYQRAEDQFIRATQNVETGNVKGGLKEAEKSTPFFDTAELEAIRMDIMGAADLLIQKAIEGDANKYALATLDKATTARAKCDAILLNNRYDREQSIAQIRRSEYEARHAANIAQSVRSLQRNDQAWEKLMLVYEIQMERIGKEIGQEQLPFDNGPIAAADSLILYIRDLQTKSSSSGDLSGKLIEKLRVIANKIDPNIFTTDPMLLADDVDNRITTLLADNTRMIEEISHLEAAKEEVSAELQSRTEREDKFRTAKALINPSEGELLYSPSNDIILRLPGLSFDVNQSDIKDEHISLLEKVRKIIEMFDYSQIIIEGHTDSRGDPAANASLSEKRAYAVMQYLRQAMLIGADKIKAMGYGAHKPVASNETVDGRTKNRRIDIIIMN